MAKGKKQVKEVNPLYMTTREVAAFLGLRPRPCRRRAAARTSRSPTSRQVRRRLLPPLRLSRVRWHLARKRLLLRPRVRRRRRSPRRRGRTTRYPTATSTCLCPKTSF